MTSNSGNKIANQFIIEDDFTNSIFFQSYDSMIAQKKNDLLPWVITMPTEVTTERGFIWFNNTARKNKLIIIKDIRKTFKHKFINYFGNMIGVTGVYFHHGYNSTELKKYK